MSTCRACSAPLEPNRAQCEACRAWNLSAPATRAKPVALSSVDVPPHDRIPVGPWDPAFGGGVVPTSITLLEGARGAGKSTFALQWCDAIAAATSRRPLYMGIEEATTEVRLRADRLPLTHFPSIDVIPSFDAADHLAHLEWLAASTDPAEIPGAILLDSLSALAGDDRQANVLALRMLRAISKRHRIPSILIAHINKQDDFAGAMTLQHDVDTLLTLVLESDTDLRFLNVGKNRFGPANFEICLDMKAAGLSLHPCEKCGTAGHEARRCPEKAAKKKRAGPALTSEKRNP